MTLTFIHPTHLPIFSILRLSVPWLWVTQYNHIIITGNGHCTGCGSSLGGPSGSATVSVSPAAATLVMSAAACVCLLASSVERARIAASNQTTQLNDVTSSNIRRRPQRQLLRRRTQLRTCTATSIHSSLVYRQQINRVRHGGQLLVKTAKSTSRPR